jgi:hypothetical protein
MTSIQFDDVPTRLDRTDAEEASTMLRMIGSALALVALLGLAACNSITGVAEETNKQELVEIGPETALPSRSVSVFHAQRKMELEGPETALPSRAVSVYHAERP